MSSKPLIWIGLFIGSSVGSYIPAFWGADIFSASSVILGSIGGLFGVWIGFKLSQF